MIPFRVLKSDDIQSIHEATLHVLSEVGIVLSQREMRDKLLAAGGSIQGDRLLLPPEMVENAIESSGKEAAIRGRNGKTANLGDGTLHWHNLGGARDVYDPVSRKVRRATIQDVRDSTRLLDALDHATTITPFFTPTDVPGALMSLAMYRYALPNTTKPLQGPGIQSAREVKFAIEMAEVIGPAEQVLSLSVSPLSPLTFPDDLVSAMMEIAQNNIVFGPLPCPTAGTTAPLSLAGALAQQNAEVLASIVIVQIVNPGLPAIYCGRLAMMEPRTGSSVWGGVELGIASAATVQIGHHYGLPVNVYGFSTNAHSLDIQSGYERSINAILPALAGADELSGIGEMNAGMMGSYAQMVCDNEIAASVHRVLRGFAVNQDSLAVEVIANAMESHGNYIGQEHTVKYLMEGEILITKLADRRSFTEWQRSGHEGMAERSIVEAEQILAEHQVPPLDRHQEAQLDKIMEAAELEHK